MHETWVNTENYQIMMVSLGEKPHFSTMFSTTSQLSFIVENITFNCKTFFTTQK
jgi:hypothetical protein